jgi:hypothetical protein
MVGIQGSGKSFIAEHYLKRANYDVVSNDKSGGRDKVGKMSRHFVDSQITGFQNFDQITQMSTCGQGEFLLGQLFISPNILVTLSKVKLRVF